jgi:aspartyl-tRNA(Asn)/glutamyl-tRNA(Gln) amidotransferase subunit B
MPGVLPVLNGRAVALGITAALATHCKVHPRSIFARKNYFYPDLPKGYQISQYEEPLATGGWLEIEAPRADAARSGLASRASTWRRTPASRSTTPRWSAATRRTST